MKDLIQALKDNEKPFGLMTEEMQGKAKEIGVMSFAELGLGGNWLDLPVLDKGWYEGTTYRLRPDYEEEPEIVECEVKVNEGNGLLGFKHDSRQRYLHGVVDDPDFIGFKYEDGTISHLAKIYRWENDRQILYTNNMGDVEVLTPTHVLFRRSK